MKNKTRRRTAAPTLTDDRMLVAAATSTVDVPWTSDSADPVTRSAIEAVVDHLRTGYRIAVADWELLGGEHDLNLKVTTTDRTFLLAKLTAAAADDPDWTWRLGLLEHLHQAGTEFTPQLHRPTNGRLGLAVELNSSAHQLIVTSWLPGLRLADLARHSPTLLTDLGQVIGKLTIALADAPAAPATLHRHRWDTTEAATTIRAHLPAVTDPALRGLAETMAERFHEHAEPRLATLPWQITHHDLNDFNVLAVRGPEGTRISGVVDIADALPAPRVCELAVAAAYAMLRKPDPLSALATVVAGYCRTQQLTEDEIEALFAIAGARLALNATVWTHRVARTGTDYGVQRARHTWTTLQQLAAIPTAVATGVIRAAANHPPRPPRTVPAATAKVLDHLRLVEVDLSVASRLFDHLDLPAAAGSPDPTAIAATVRSAAGPDAAPVGASLTSRFTRLARRNDHRGEPATIHLGRDLHLPPGTAIHNPVAGIARIGPDDGIVVHHRRPWTSIDTVLEDVIPDIGDEVIHNPSNPSLDPDNSDSGVHIRWAGLKPAIDQGPVAAGQILGTATTEPVRIAVFTDEESATLAPLDFVPAGQVAGWSEVSPDPAPLLGLTDSADLTAGAADSGWPVARVLAAREEHFGRSQRHYYDAPMNLVRGRDAWLYDENGLGYLDPINNVSHVGHGNPRVAEAAHRQLRRLNTNSRLVYDAVARYAQRLTALLPDPLDVVFLVCTGSEANDLAVRIARQVTGREHLVVLGGAYHGNTATVTGISPNRYRGPGGSGPPPTTHEAPMPDRYRGPYGYDDPEAGPRYAADLAQIVSEMAADGTPPAALIAESLMGTAGTIVHPPGFLASAAAAVRAAGGLVIFDEVQVGFGRTGDSFWAFQPQGVVPDIVTMGKPIGNGHPLAAVVTTRAVADAFDNGMKYFNTFGGNPVSCEIGLTVLDEIEQRGLEARAADLGSRFAAGLHRLSERHQLIGDVRGAGLYLGVDLVTDRATKQPATAAAQQISERLKDLGILSYPTGIGNNVLKLKPPMVITQSDIDAYLSTLDYVLTEF